MKNNKALVTVVCCLHGDELFGLKLFKYLEKRIDYFSGLKIILANQKAIAAGKRFLDSDLNRVFPGKLKGDHEEKLAREILKEIGKTKYLLDIHTTTSDIKMTPVVTNLNKKIRQVINLTQSREVVKMSKKFASHSMIGQFNNGVSLEFNFKYARRQEVLQQTVKLIAALLKGKSKTAKDRKVFQVDSVIEKNVVLPSRAKNFVKYKNRYVFLLDEKSYKDMRGFTASNYRYRLI